MNLILNNPYRTVGLLVGATAREMLSLKSKIKVFTNIGNKITSEYDFFHFT